MIKKIIVGFLAVLSLALLGLVIFAAAVDLDHYKPLAVNWMKANKQRALAIDGPIGLSVFPQLALTLSDVSLSEQNSTKLFFKGQRIRMAVQLLPLLTGRFEVGKLEAEGVQLSYLRDAKGRRNFDDMLGDKAATAGSTPPAGSSSSSKAAPVDFDIKGVTLRAASVYVRDELAGLDGSVNVVNLEMGRLADGLQTPVKLDAAVDFKTPAVKGAVTGSTQLTLHLAEVAGASTGRTVLSATDLSFNGSTATLKNAAGQLKGNLSLDAASGATSLQDLTVSLSGELAGIALEGSRLSVKQLDFEPQAKKLVIQSLSVDVKGQYAGNAVRARLDWPNLNAQGTQISGSALTGDFSMAGQTPMVGKFSSAAPTGNFELLRIPQFKLALDGGSQGSGAITADAVVRPSSVELALEQLQGELKLPVAGAQQVFSIAGAASYAAGKKKTAGWDLRGAWNAEPYATSGSLTFTEAEPIVHAKFQLATFNANQWQGAAPKGKSDSDKKPASPQATPAPDAAKTAAKSASADAVDLSAATSFKGSIDAVVNKLTLGNVVFEAASVSLRSDGKRLEIPTFAARVWQGNVSGSGAVVPANQSIALKAVADGIRIEQATKALTGRDKVVGTGRMVVDVHSNGRTMPQMRSALAGAAQMQLRDGAVKGINLAKTMREAKAALSMRKDNVQRAREEEQTDFSEITASFVIANGIASSSDLVGKSPFLRVTGEGQIDLGQSTINYLLKTTVTGDAQGQDATELAALRGVQVPVQLTGSLDDVQYKVQWSAVTTSVAKEVLKGKLGDSLKEKLGLSSKKEAVPANAGTGTAPAQPAQQPSPKDQLKDKLRRLLR